MNIRAVTLGIPLAARIDPRQIADAATTLRRIRERYVESGFAVDSLRLTSPAVTSILDEPAQMAAFASDYDAAVVANDITYAGVGPAQLTGPDANLDWIDAAADLVLASQRLATSAMVGDADAGVNVAAVWRTAAAVRRIADSTENGFGNLLFAMQANYGPGGPFFPTGYHDGGPPSFALALEAADLAIAAFAAPTLPEARERLVSSLQTVGEQLAAIGADLADPGLRFGGIDLSLAPFPDDAKSIGVALERLGLARFGGPGSLATAAFLADCLRRVAVPQCGFSGVMLPLLEDSALARNSDDGALGVDALLTCSAVCGVGLDTVPLPGDTTVAQLAGVMLDVAALAVTLDKPLTARLMPVPGVAAGDRTCFDFPYFVNARTLAPSTSGPSGALERTGHWDLRPRR